MTKSLKIAAAAALLSTLAFGTAFAAPGEGEYYEGASRTPIFQGSAASGAGTAATAVIPTGEGAYYEGADKNPNIDAMSTGSISNAPVPVTPRVGEGDYYEGVQPRY